ncbi:hypothetical protein P5V15_012702 [Pogonomyrmex californicus]
MKRGTKCIVQTINLSNPKTCVKPKIRRLVRVDADSSFGTNHVSDHWTPRPVKVCTLKDVQKICPPKFCDCPETPPPLSTGEKLLRVTAFFIKAAIVAGLICWTYTEGLWGDSTETEDLYYRMISTIFPDLPDRSAQLEEIREIVEAYNRMLVKDMDIIVSVPREIHRRLQGILFPCDTTKKKTS